MAERANRAHWFTGRVGEVLTDVLAGGMPLATLSAAETAEAIEELAEAMRRQHGMLLRLLAHADARDCAADDGATSTGAWLADRARLPLPAARRLARTARRLANEGLDSTAEAALAGDLEGAQVDVIVEAMTSLPRWVQPEDRRRAEKHLLELAAEHDARALTVLAKHLVHVVDPDRAEEELARQLEREEAEARRKTTMRVWDDGNGITHGRFRIPTAHGAMLATALNALASPKRPDAIERHREAGAHADPEASLSSDVAAPATADDAGLVIERSAAEVLGEAFCLLVERLPVDDLPQAGRVNASVVVTMTLDSLLDGLRPATLSTGSRSPPLKRA